MRGLTAGQAAYDSEKIDGLFGVCEAITKGEREGKESMARDRDRGNRKGVGV